MPIRPENRKRYPKNWPEISKRIRFERAKGRCECVGECGAFHIPRRCTALHGKMHPQTGSIVVLTTAHLPGREIEQCEDRDLKAMCQRCHNCMDASMRQAGIKERQRSKAAMGDLLDGKQQ